MSVDRRGFIRTSSLALAAGALAPRGLVARAPATARQSPLQPLRGNVGIFVGRGGTLGWYVSPDAVVVVDSQFADSAEAFLQALRQRSSRNVDALINTHHHGDHTGGNAVFRAASTRMIVGHANVPELMRRQAGANAQPAVPDVTFTDTWRQSFGTETVRAKYYAPAHTGGDAVIFFENANVAHMGDVGFNQRHPIVDLPSGASVRGWVRLLEGVHADHDDQTIFIFGHAKEGTEVTGRRDSLLVLRDYFTAVLEHAQRGITAGRSRDEVTAIESIPRFADWASTPPRLSLQSVVGAAFDELTGG
jgi:cyclase